MNIETVLFKSHSQKPKSIILNKEKSIISNDNIIICVKNYEFNNKLIIKYKVKLKILYTLDYDDETFHFIGISMKDIEKNNMIPNDSEINKKEFWWENIYDKNYSLNVGDIIIIRYNENGHLDNMSVDDYNVLEKLIIQPEILYSDETDSRTSADFESTDEDYDPKYDEEESEDDEVSEHDEVSEDEILGNLILDE